MIFWKHTSQWLDDNYMGYGPRIMQEHHEGYALNKTIIQDIHKKKKNYLPTQLLPVVVT